MRSSEHGLALQPPERRFIGRILSGVPSSWPVEGDAAFTKRLLDACVAEGVAPLVHFLVRATPSWPSWPAPVRERLAHEARMEMALDMLREQDLIAALRALSAAGIGTLLLKGTPLAYSHYAASGLRPRCDTDLLVAPADRQKTQLVLEALGYRRRNGVSGTLVSYEDLYCRNDGTVEHAIDLHWRVNNAQVFARALRHDEMHARSVPIPLLGEAARALCPPHALLLACMHRAAHLGADGHDADRLIWLYDIHLLANAMDADEWRQFADLCLARAMRRITLDAFACTHDALGTLFPADVMQRLGVPMPVEISAAYLNADRARLLITDLRALGTWRERGTLLRETCCPPREYVLAKYRARHRWLLPWLYVRRAVEAGWKFVRS
jgi:hypothetical protein